MEIMPIVPYFAPLHYRVLKQSYFGSYENRSNQRDKDRQDSLFDSFIVIVDVLLFCWASLKDANIKEILNTYSVATRM
jgi:hypothetical protein